MKTKEQEPANWFDDVLNYYEIQTVLALHRDLNSWIIRWDGKQDLEWLELNEAIGQQQPYHFEIQYGKQPARDAYYLRMLKEAQAKGRLVLGELYGLNDIFYPFSTDPERRTFFYAGQFSLEPLDWPRVSGVWQQLTGHEAASANPAFVDFVRAALRVPVIEERMLPGIGEFFALYEQFLSGNARASLHDEVYYLKNEVFSRFWPNSDWVARAVNSEQYHLTPWYYDGELTEWMKAEMQISRLPTVAMALMPIYPPDEAMSPMERLVNNYRIQHECVRYVTAMPESGAHPLQDYGVTVLTSPGASKSRAKAQLELRERAQELQDFVKKRFGLRTLVGIGREVSAGESLHSSHAEAVLALHLCVQLEKDVLFFQPEHAAEGVISFSKLHAAALRLADSFTRDSMNEVKVAADFYVRLVLIYADKRFEVVHSQFLVMIFQLIQNVQKRHVLRQEAVDRVATELSSRLEAAQSVSQLIESFNEALTRLWFFSSKALEGPKSMRLTTTLQYLSDNFAEQLRLPDVARKAGFSVPAFSRIFKQATGTSFLGYLRALRVDHAKKLLRTSSLSIEQVALACGFQSQHHLIRSFKKVTNSTPGDYRRRVRTDPGAAP